MYRRTPLLIASLFLLTVSNAYSENIDIAGGFKITGEVIKKTSEKTYVDVGFTLLAIPNNAVLKISESEEVESNKPSDEHFYQNTRDGLEKSVNHWVNEIGTAVVAIRTPTGLGSGFIVHKSGYLITNHHVIAGEHEISVTIYKKDIKGAFIKKQYDDVAIACSSPEWDLAMLKINTDEPIIFKTVALASSEYLNQGQQVFAIGSPLGLERSVSEGIISLKNRLIDGRLFIQTTAQISPGNSGGPLFNLKGEVVGVNNMKVIAMGAEGLGFSIPSNMLKMFISNRESFSFDPRNPNSGFRYNAPPK